MPGFLSTRKGVPLLLIPEYSGINKGQRVPDRSKTAHRKPLVKCFLTAISDFLEEISSLSQSVVFLYFFALITEEGFLISPCYSLELYLQMGISFLLSLVFL